MSYHEQVRAIIARELEARGWSQRELCRRTKTVNHGALSAFMVGRTIAMKADALFEMEQALGISFVSQVAGLPSTLQPEVAPVNLRHPWQCPICKVVHAPWVDSCACAKQRRATDEPRTVDESVAGD